MADKSEKDIMKNINKIPLYALLVAISWFISFEIIILTYNPRTCQLELEAKNGTIVMKAENDTTDYMHGKNGDPLCNKVNCLRKCCPENQVVTVDVNYNPICTNGTNEVFPSHFPYYITENVTMENLCPPNSDKYYIEENFTLQKSGCLRYDVHVVDHYHYCVDYDTWIVICEKKPDATPDFRDTISIGE